MAQLARKLALLVEYDGTGYHGFQAQTNAQTVQEVLEKALDNITGESARLNGASRTDTGVHALGQVASFITRSAHSPETFVAALNHHLLEDVAVQACCEVEPDFDARRHAKSRHYRYVVLNRNRPSPLARGYALWVREALNVEAMDRGARALVGRHDLASFSGPLPHSQTSTVRRVYKAKTRQAGPFVYFDIKAEAFLPQQIRRTMGVLLAVGKGELEPETMEQFRDRPVQGAASAAAPARGLYLTQITYPEGTVDFGKTEVCSKALPVLAAIISGQEGP